MSQPNVEKIVTSKPIQKVSLRGKSPVPVDEADPRIAQLVRLGLTEAEAIQLISEQW